MRVRSVENQMSLTMWKRILIRLAFDLVIELVCENAKLAGKPWVNDFCDFAKKVKEKI